MGNYNNIKPYAEFAHKAAEGGGIEKYLDDYGKGKYDLGVATEREKEGQKALVLIGATVLLWELGKIGIRKIKNMGKAKKENAIAKSEKARREYLKCVNINDSDYEIQEDRESED